MWIRYTLQRVVELYPMGYPPSPYLPFYTTTGIETMLFNPHQKRSLESTKYQPFQYNHEKVNHLKIWKINTNMG